MECSNKIKDILVELKRYLLSVLIGNIFMAVELIFSIDKYICRVKLLVTRPLQSTGHLLSTIFMVKPLTPISTINYQE